MLAEEKRMEVDEFLMLVKDTIQPAVQNSLAKMDVPLTELLKDDLGRLFILYRSLNQDQILTSSQSVTTTAISNTNRSCGC